MYQTCERCGLFHPASAPCMSFELAGGELQTGLRPGSVLAGRYRIIRVLHRGGMSVVYLAEDAKLNGREIALKELRLQDGASDEDLREAEAWFARESALLSVLHHPLIPVFYSVFREEGRSYIAQEYVPGENLEDLVRRQGPIEPDVALAWGIALSQMLHCLHGLPEPVVFRDLKPSNVVLRSLWSSPDRRLAVVDFGIARSFSEAPVGTVIGTPGYAPPEQYQGIATPQSDIYALGATLHRLLTGYDPEHGTPFTFPAVRSLNPGVSPALAAIVSRATSLNPSARFASAHEMSEALSALAPPAAHAPARRRRRTSLFDSTWMAVTAALVGISLLTRLAAFVAAPPSQDWPGYGMVGYGLGGSPPPVATGIWQCSNSPSFGPMIRQLGSGQSSLLVACGTDGTAWLLDTQRGQLTRYAPDGSATVTKAQMSTSAFDTITPIANPGAAQGDYVWLTGHTNHVALFDPGGHFHQYTIGIPGATTIIPVYGGPGGSLVFQIPGGQQMYELTASGHLAPGPAV